MVLILGRRRQLCTAEQVPVAEVCRSCGPTCGAGSSKSGCSSTA